MKYKIYTKSGQLLGKEYFINQDGQIYRYYYWHSDFYGTSGTTIQILDNEDYIIEVKE